MEKCAWGPCKEPVSIRVGWHCSEHGARPSTYCEEHGEVALDLQRASALACSHRGHRASELVMLNLMEAVRVRPIVNT